MNRLAFLLVSVLALGAGAAPQALAQTVKPAAQPGDFQALVGPGFDALFEQADEVCPEKHLRGLKPAEALDAEEVFIAALPDAQRQRVVSAEPKDADGGYASCENRNGASCAAVAGMRAIDKAGLMRAFVDSACHQDLQR